MLERLLKPKTTTDALVLQLMRKLEDQQKQINDQQLWMFKLASKTGFTWKNNKWVKKV